MTLKPFYLTAALPLLVGYAFATSAMATAQSTDKTDQTRSNLMLETFDGNGDGKIARDEFEQVKAQRFEEADTDNSGTLSQDELKSHRESRRMQRHDARFARMDADGSGELSAEEFQINRSNKNMFDHLDSNQDDVIDADELPQPGQFRGRHQGMHSPE